MCDCARLSSLDISIPVRYFFERFASVLVWWSELYERTRIANTHLAGIFCENRGRANGEKGWAAAAQQQSHERFRLLPQTTVHKQLQADILRLGYRAAPRQKQYGEGKFFQVLQPPLPITQSRWERAAEFVRD